MKRVFLSLVILLLFLHVSCINNANENENENNIIPIPEVERPDEIKDLPKDPESLVSYLEKNLDSFDDKKRELSLFYLEDILSSNLALVGNIVWEDDIQKSLLSLPKKTILKEEDLENINDEDIKKELQKITKSYYAFQRINENIIPVIDYEKMLVLSDKIKDDFKEYYNLKIEENKMPIIQSGKIELEAREILDRLNKSESFIIKNKDFTRVKEMVDRLQYNLYLFLSGTTLSPVVDETNSIKKDYLKLINDIKEPKTISERAFLKGMEILEKNNNVYDDATLEKMRNLVFNSIYELKQKINLR